MPRKASPAEIFRYYKVKKFMGDDGRGAARVNMEGTYPFPLAPPLLCQHWSAPTGDVTLSAEDMAPTPVSYPYSTKQPPPPTPPVDFEGDDDLEEGDEDEFYAEEEEEEDRHYWLHLPTAAKFLLAGGVAGAGELIDPKSLTPSGTLTLVAQYLERVPHRLIDSRYT